ncbi:amino acid adenylation domain-containing protein [Streptomyces sp. NPDC094468]|uniref:non-ribosomal peptide synthetase n=1 Tax=Streptomyces sp. NPDC094468 TaxID=3366066 RepID=UPI0038100697
MTQDSAESIAQGEDTHVVDRLVRERARRAPKTTALVYHGARISYAELDARVNRLARYLRALGVGPDVPVGVCLERGTDLPVALLAVLRTGGAYVPLDPAYPEERLGHMLRDARPPVLLTQRNLHERLPGEDRRTVLLDADAPTIDRFGSEPLDDVQIHPDNLAYIIYTSGSTGRPKGTMLTRRGLAQLARAQLKTFVLTPEDRVLQWASASFDASVFEMVMAFGAGAELHLAARDEVVPGPGLVRLLVDSRITALTIPPSALSALPEGEFPDLALLVAAGEALPRPLADRWSAGRRMVNAYGPTETTVWATVQPVEAGDGGAPPIGAPVGDFRTYVLDAALDPVPAGGVGELYLAGPAVGRGYLGLPGRTAAAFVPDPFGPAGTRMYRTGDLVRCRADGLLEFAGRADRQAKVRGFRIELGEIEATLAAHEDVRECVVVILDAVGEADSGSADVRIVAYPVLSGAAAVSAKELRAFLESRLPEHMVPSAVVPLSRLPLTVNGKLDHAALPLPEQAAHRDDKVRPRNEIEDLVAGIWSDVLGVEDLGVTDDFFALGGNSLKATRLGTRISRVLQVDIPLREVLKARTLEKCARLVEEALAREATTTGEKEPAHAVEGR